MYIPKTCTNIYFKRSSNHPGVSETSGITWQDSYKPQTFQNAQEYFNLTLCISSLAYMKNHICLETALRSLLSCLH